MQLFETKRLLVRPLSHKDLSALTAILSDPEVMKYSVRGVCDEAATKAFIDWCLTCYSSQGVGPWALVEKETGELVGFCGVEPELIAGVEEINLGYRLAQKFWNQGLATEAVHGVLEYAFRHKGCESIVAIIEPEHIASVRVSEKAGFTRYTMLEFHNRPVRIYRMNSQEWEMASSR
ncbi:GNAT family N-acetyltransferase [Aliagarivorans marinus]|uniref:GNAT family N-acetyltransferase n=1 Tax=Aliagarivorans marinus TaxID=561965 RepID=UPI00047A6A74|nr:GNAT family N-acetyltransferase [Aliagarivorans marinus]